MSQDFMDPELFADFIIEAKEHLETIEPNLLELEKTPDNLNLLNDIFRPMHSLKGASGFLGLNKINHLAHKAENILDELRKGEMVVTSEIMDVILSATDALRQLIDNLEATNSEGDVETESIMDQIESIMKGEYSESGASSESSNSASSSDTASESEASDLGGNISVVEWIENLEHSDEYALTSFGEGHLRDFVEEAHEMNESINASLLTLEQEGSDPEHVNDLFRFFHNLKGNSGILGYNELNSITHEAETLLNKVRHDEMSVSRELIDLLLLVSDIMDALVSQIDVTIGKVKPFNIKEIVDILNKACSGGEITMPKALTAQKAQKASAGQAQSATSTVDDEDIEIYTVAVNLQKDIIAKALEALGKDATQADQVDAVHRALVAVQNSSNFVKFADVAEYAERTAGLVDQARTSGLDFAMMIDILSQEVAIIFEISDKALANAKSVASAPAPAPAAQEKKAEVKQEAPKAEEKKAEVKKEAPKAEAAPAAKAAAKPAPKADAKPEEQRTAANSTIRVDHEKLDHLMNLIGELIINRNRYSMIAKQLEETDAQANLGEIAQNLSETTYGMARISDELQDTIMKVRMVPVSSVFSRFPRLVRDLSRKSSKDVELILEGEETELDKSVVEVIGDPLVHLIRNSVDHGIEPEEVRLERGKPAKGRVTLRAYHKGNSVAIEIEDDGNGLDPEKLREVAVRKGLMTMEEAKLLDDREARELIFAPGFSSAEQITDISGRGVGMDVVRTNIKNLKGSINITSELGKGTRFTLLLPLTLAIIDALMINVSGEMFAIPLDAVSETTKIEAARLTDVKGRKAVTLRGEILGIVELAEILNLEQSPLPDVLSIVVIHDNERRLGVVVDRLLERQEIVIKPLGAYLGDVKGISGATIMGDGSVILILDPHEIYLSATSKSSMSSN